MNLEIKVAEQILLSDTRLKQIYSEKYELSFECKHGRQIALNRKSSTRAINVWIQNYIDPNTMGLSESAKMSFYPLTKPRAHLSAPRLTGPYTTPSGTSRSGNDCWYVSVTQEVDFRRILLQYFR